MPTDFNTRVCAEIILGENKVGLYGGKLEDNAGAFIAFEDLPRPVKELPWPEDCEGPIITLIIPNLHCLKLMEDMLAGARKILTELEASPDGEVSA